MPTEPPPLLGIRRGVVYPAQVQTVDRQPVLFGILGEAAPLSPIQGEGENRMALNCAGSQDRGIHYERERQSAIRAYFTFGASAF